MNKTQDIIDELNVLLKIDPEAVSKLILTEIPITITPMQQVQETKGLLIHGACVDETLEGQYLSVHRLLYYLGVHILSDQRTDDHRGPITRVDKFINEEEMDKLYNECLAKLDKERKDD